MAKLFGLHLQEKLIYTSFEEELQLLSDNSSPFRCLPDADRRLGKEQVRVLNIAKSPISNALLDVHDTIPEIEGNENEPDVKMKVELISYHPVYTKLPDNGTKATVRLDIGQDDSAASMLRPLFWAVAAALDLASVATGDSQHKRLRQDFHSSLSGRAIEIGGGLCEFRFEVIQHEEPPRWKKFFSMMSTTAGQLLITAIGFPAIVREAVDIVNEALDSIIGNGTPVFSGRPMTLALSKRAWNEYTAGTDRIKLGVLTPGFCVLVPHGHCSELMQANPYFMASHGVLLPGDLPVSKYIAGAADPFQHIPYAVLRVRMAAMNCNPSW